jgi:MYXO-CTERM domain-containing protein
MGDGAHSLRAPHHGVLMMAAVAIALTWVSSAIADGAFPDEFSIHFPPDAPSRILMGANFGLLVSEDDGKTWRYSCEPWVVAGSNAALANNSVSLYQITADGVFLATSVNVTRSSDVACTWPTSTGFVSGHRVADLFPDPNDASFVLAIVVLTNPTNITSYIVASHDGGRTFDAPHLFETADLLTGVEIARSRPGLVYATSISLSGGDAKFLTSPDRGASWTATTVPIPPQTEPRILGIDPVDEKKVYLRVMAAVSDSILVTGDSGQSFQTILPPIGVPLSSFLRAGDGTLFAGTRTGKLYVQPPGATGFTVRDAPHLRCLGQRPGTARLYACADIVADGYSLATSDDNGVTFQPMMSFRDLLGPLTCPEVQTNCAAHWQRIQGVLGIKPSDGGTPGTADAGGSGTDAGTSATPAGGQASSGCSSASGGGGLILTLIALALLGRRKAPWVGRA